jgi:diadenosine tetraphosphate (Ap4A) HIT family hydrolase
MSCGAVPPCPLCAQAGGNLVHRAARWRVVRVADAGFPAFYRVIWNAHVAEFSDLEPAERAECMEVVARVERALRDQLGPTKINLASLGNMVPHLHWHVIARFDWDSHFPDPVWAQTRRQVEPAAAARLAVSLERLDLAVREALDSQSR